MQQLVLSFDNRSEVLELPFPLQEHNITMPTNTYDFNTINKGEVLAIGKKKLKEMTINSVFPSKDYPFLLTHSFPSPSVCIQTIDRWRLSGKPIRVAIMDTEINLAMAITSFDYGKDSNDGSGDVSFSLSLREYAYLNTERSKEVGSSLSLRQRPSTRGKNMDFYITKQAGDLWDLADDKLDDVFRYKEILRLNSINDPRNISANTKLKMPKE